MEDLKIIIENPKGSHKVFVEESDTSEWKDYPLRSVTYPVDYGYIEGYKSEDDEDLDVFVGTGELSGYMKIWRCDVPIETKFIMNVTQEEFGEIITLFASVVTEKGEFKTESEFRSKLQEYKR